MAARLQPEPVPTRGTDGATGVYTSIELLLSYRHRARDLRLFARRPARASVAGEARSRFRGRGIEFEEVRLYQPGDDIRTIDWRVSARTGKAHTKLFREERERPVHILVDQRSAMFFGSAERFKSVLAAELAAGIAWAAYAGSDRIGGQVIGDDRESDVRARRNKQAVLGFLHELQAFNERLPGAGIGTQTLARMIEDCRHITRPGTAVFIISDFHDVDTATEKNLAVLGRHTDITLIRVQDALELEPPARGRLPVSDGRERTAVAMSPALVAAYRAELAGREVVLKQACARARAVLLTIDTNEDPLVFLRRQYAAR